MKELLFILLFPFGLFSQTVELVNESMSECNESIEPELILNHIQSKEIINDILYLSVGHKENCCFKPETTITFRNDTLFVNQENISGMWCGCECCFSQNFVITGVEDTCFTTVYNKKVIKISSLGRIKLPDEYIFNEPIWFNQGNIHNEKIGMWKYYFKNTNIVKSIRYYSEEWERPYLQWYIEYNKNGNRVSIGLRFSKNDNIWIYENEHYERLLKEINIKKINFLNL